MKRLLGITMILGLLATFSGMAQDVQPKNLAIDLGNKVKLEMVLIPEGPFMMGSAAKDKDRIFSRWEPSLHEVKIRKPFYIGKYEVTQEQWVAIMGKNPSNFKAPKLPVVNVSWEDCQEFIEKLNEKTNGGFCLPTETEWECACRAGTRTAYSFGDQITRKDANYIYVTNILAPQIPLVPVGRYKPNGFGLYDMHGNVFEWCDLENHQEKYFRTRGGSESSLPRSAANEMRSPNYRNPYTGFRLTKIESLIVQEKGSEKVELIDLGQRVKLEMVLIPAGKFVMGSSTPEKARSPFGGTQHEVTLTKPFYMGKYEVTLEQWNVVMGNNPIRGRAAKLPVDKVSWEECQDFIKKLNAKTNGGYRLPTEAEWEYACRAGTTTEYSYGDNITEDDANCFGGGLLPVGLYKPNPFGLYDMDGNVQEFCQDLYAPYQEGAATDPKGPLTSDAVLKLPGITLHVIRGGNTYSSNPSSYRGRAMWNEKTSVTGLRLAKTK
ncbi:MAG: formylglycine-generating enzyme family protein [Planctomycetota bacterium]|nr:formylglycine-generating enzyme family protein [Planctomycetota bacterium]